MSSRDEEYTIVNTTNQLQPPLRDLRYFSQGRPSQLNRKPTATHNTYVCSGVPASGLGAKDLVLSGGRQRKLWQEVPLVLVNELAGNCALTAPEQPQASLHPPCPPPSCYLLRPLALRCYWRFIFLWLIISPSRIACGVGCLGSGGRLPSVSQAKGRLAAA
jgi:hypothetical protein